MTGTGLPVQFTSLIGRKAPIAEIQATLGNSRLVTLTGPAGTGKTRLAVELGRRMGQDKDAKVWFVDLTPVRDPRMLGQAILSVFGEREEAGRSAVQIMAANLEAELSLLILDNCEHLVEACAEVALEVLKLNATARVLATSRIPLTIPGEVRWPVPPLDADDAIALFIDRARMVAPAFQVTPELAQAVAELCRRLDRLPLALELAAARMGQLTVHEVLARLDQRSQLLVDRSRGVPARHRTLSAALDWSHDLLGPEEQRRFARLSVFAGGFDVAAAEEVAAADLETLSRLVDQSLLVPGGGVDRRVRFRLLESVREYAAERLRGGDEAKVTEAAHFTYFSKLARAAEPELRGPDQVRWLDRLEEELDNLRAALDWGLRNDPEAAIETMGAIAWFWNVHGHYLEPFRRLNELLTAAPNAGPRVRAIALASLGRLALNIRGAPGAAAALDESIELWRRLDEQKGLAHALMSRGLLAIVLRQPRDECEGPIREALAVARRSGDRHHEAETTMYLGVTAFRLAGETATGLAMVQEAAGLAREQGNLWLLAYALDHQAAIELEMGELAGAWAHLTEALELWSGLRDPHWLPATNALLGRVALAKRDLQDARRHLEAAVRLRDFEEPRDFPLGGPWLGIEPMADLAASQGEYERAARLQGASDARAFAIYEPRPLDRQPWFSAAVQAHGIDRVRSAWLEGQRMTPAQAIAYGRARYDEERPPLEPLTRREREIATLVSQGLRNRDIAERLFISERTVEGHLEHIREKLGVHTRAEVAVWASSHRPG